MKIHQMNLNKSKIALDGFNRYISRDTLDTIYLVQEMYWYNNRIPGLPKMYNVYGTQNSHAVIIAPRFFPLLLVNDGLHEIGQRKLAFSQPSRNLCLVNHPESCVWSTIPKLAFGQPS